MRVRVPIEKHSTANEHQQKILKLFRKFNAQHNKNFNDISDEVDEDEPHESGESHEEELSDLEILGVSRADHPCIEEALVEKQTCGMKSRPCAHELFGIARKSLA